MIVSNNSRNKTTIISRDVLVCQHFITFTTHWWFCHEKSGNPQSQSNALTMLFHCVCNTMKKVLPMHFFTVNALVTRWVNFGSKWKRQHS